MRVRHANFHRIAQGGEADHFEFVPFEQAELSPMARSFYADSKRVSNALIKSELGVSLRYPDYRAGLAAILAAGG